MRGSSFLWRALEAARRDHLAEAGEAPPTPGSAGATRRALLKAIVAAGAVSALPRPARAATPGRVAIIGGGIAGLSALHYLRTAGVDARLYEARQRIGGRMFTQRPADGPAFEVGGQLVNSDHRDLRALLDHFRIPLVDRKAEPHALVVLANGRRVAEAELAQALRGIAGQIDRDAARVDKEPRYAAAIDRLSAKAYLDRHAALIHEPWARALLESSIRTEFGAEPEDSSAMSFLFNLPTVEGERFEILGQSDEHYVIQGGSGALPEAIAEAHRDRIETGKRLVSIALAAGTHRLSFLDGSEAIADQIVVAVPAGIMRQIGYRVPLPASLRAYIAEAELGRNEKIQAVAAEAVWKAPMGIGGELWNVDPASAALGWDGSVHRADRVDPVWTWFLGGDQVEDVATSPQARAAAFAALAEPAIPGLAAVTATGPFRRTGWCRDPLTLGGYVNYRPSQLTRFGHLLAAEGATINEQTVPGNGRIWFAGEHLSDAWFGFMNGGASSGRLAAEMILGRKLLKLQA
ncbi:FAD-dependent oxidoreductase [Sphingomonas sp.]|uniref:flavin monoamine oxidase family protein n=1 Tax=Sphingomonas sp. TaxID=28214 RepID=UPI001B01E269|nr:FAD-dependent oxidoreductase [Sphingomonas sp.]MBO9714234.1 FAD-dependent oxidoreductase [Sphingomonas sp.]